MTEAVGAAALRLALEDNSADLLAYFERRLSEPQDAADLLSETAMTAWRRVDTLPAEDPTRLRMWLFGIARLILGNHRRARRRHSAMVDKLREMLTLTGPRRAEDHSTVVAVRDAVRRLKEEQRELILLVHWDGFSIAEAADLLAINPSTARSRYAAARSVLRDALDAEQYSA